MNSPSPDNPTADPTGRSTWLPLWLLAGCVILVFIVYPFDLQWSRVLSADSSIPGDLRRLISLSEVFAHGMGILMILITVWVLVPGQRIRIPRIALSAIVSGGLATAAKPLLPRQRPAAVQDPIQEVALTWAHHRPPGTIDPAEMYDYAWLSYPSGHAATTVGLAIGLSSVFPRGRWWFLVLAGLACLQRVVSLAHWPSDVITGVCFGLVFGWLLNSWQSPLGRRLRQWENRHTGQIIDLPPDPKPESGPADPDSVA